MHCEICGQTIPGKASRVVVEGAKLLVCSECAKHSSETWKPTWKATKPRTSTPSAPRKPTTVLEEDFLLVEDYGLKVKEAREKRGWTQEDLAAKIMEKASFIGKVETGKVTPPASVTRKLEHTLGITLTTKEAPAAAASAKPEEAGLTIGDIMMKTLGSAKGEPSEGNSGRT